MRRSGHSFSWQAGRSSYSSSSSSSTRVVTSFSSSSSSSSSSSFHSSSFSSSCRPRANLIEYGHIEAISCMSLGSSPPKLQFDAADSDVLKVESVDFNIAQNTKAHHTLEYDITDAQIVDEPRLVVRRGQSFDISITFNRAYNKTGDELKLVFQTGEKPVASRGTNIELILSDKDEPKQWGAKIKNQSDKVLNVTIFTPPTCYVAKWNFKLDVLKKTDEKKAIFRYNHKDQIYIIFNPWCKDDAVYMEDEAEREEYVLNETGEIFIGFHYDIDVKPWTYGQFQGNILDCCMYILDQSGLSWPARGNPVQIVRKIAALVNSEDDYGVLTGKWSGSFADGRSPLSWTGSVAILEEYYKTKTPIRYGQCWVFSGVTTTVCRALGIPTRSVTNFASAHDNDGSITIDTYFNDYMQPDDTMESEKEWNFHVWNEMWMSRPDLPSGYGGWQACDATPQEASDGFYCCGPAPVVAIKRGEVNLPYDCKFVFAEVNADSVHWCVHDDGDLERTRVEKRGIGKHISTKSVNGNDREDITHNYKFPEGSDEERVAVLKANQFASCHQDVYETGNADVDFELARDENTFVGESFDVIFKIKNEGKEKRTVKGRLTCRTMHYTGVPADPVSFKEVDLTLDPEERCEEVLTVSFEDYQDKLRDMCMLQITTMARVVETKQVFTKMLDFRLKKPKLAIKAPPEGRVGKQLQADISFMNPLDESLSGCTVQVDGPGLSNPTLIQCGSVGPKKTFMTTVNFTPKKAGKRQIVIIFSSRQLDDINGTHTVNVSAH